MAIVVPEWVARNERRRRILDDPSSGIAQTRYWNPLLKQIDPRLQLVFVGRVEDDPQVEPMRWHIARVNESGPDTYWPIVEADGGYREMAEDWLNRLRCGDLWNPAVRHDIGRADRLRREALERDKANHKAARVDELAVNAKSIINPGVSKSDTGWTASKRGQRGRRAA